MAELQPAGRVHFISVLLQSVQTFMCPVGLYIVQLKGLPSAFCPGWRKPAHSRCGIWLDQSWVGDGFSAWGGFSLAGVCSGCAAFHPCLQSLGCAHAAAAHARFLLSFLGYWQEGLQNILIQDFETNWRWRSVLVEDFSPPQPWVPRISGALCQSHFLPTMLNCSAFQLYC